MPIEGVLRRKKLREIGALTSAGAFATLGRSVALLAVRDRPLPLEGPWDALVAAGYFGLLELAPVLLVLSYSVPNYRFNWHTIDATRLSRHA